MIEWLPRRLKWIANHPKLLKLYIWLPHRTMLHVYVQHGEIVRIEATKKGNICH